MMFKSNKIISYALKKDNYISVSLDIVQVETKTSEKAVIETKEKVLEVKENIVKEKVNIDNLFSDVWTKKIDKKVIKDKIVNKRNLQEISKKIKTTSENKTKPVVENNNKAENIDDKQAKISTGDEVNEYIAKIKALVYDNFFPPNNSQGHKVIVVIELSSLGKVLDFRILKYSNNEALNSVSDNMKEKLMSVVFPINPNNSSKRVIINLISDK